MRVPVQPSVKVLPKVADLVWGIVLKKTGGGRVRVAVTWSTRIGG
jgi:hypothetical protein